MEASGASLAGAGAGAKDSAPAVGRFAPSPSGALHFGSLVAALGSYLSIQAKRGEWLIRIEDIDPPREPPGAAAEILRQLDAFALISQRPAVFQSQRLMRYRDVLSRLIAQEQAFPCFCTRSELAGKPHRGRCKNVRNVQPSWRLAVPGSTEICFVDGICGPQAELVGVSVGDFVLWRADGWPSYQLACVVDDADSAVTEVVRGADLLESTARQIFLQRCCGFSTPSYTHLPLVLGADGSKLSKQNLAPALDPTDCCALRTAAAQFLRDSGALAALGVD